MKFYLWLIVMLLGGIFENTLPAADKVKLEAFADTFTNIVGPIALLGAIVGVVILANRYYHQKREERIRLAEYNTPEKQRERAMAYQKHIEQRDARKASKEAARQALRARRDGRAT